jgi:hypothetical protein
MERREMNKTKKKIRYCKSIEYLQQQQQYEHDDARKYDFMLLQNDDDDQ